MSAIRLADIKTPEFRARMVLACLNANPPMKIVNMPELNEGFSAALPQTQGRKSKP